MFWYNSVFESFDEAFYGGCQIGFENWNLQAIFQPREKDYTKLNLASGFSKSLTKSSTYLETSILCEFFKIP